MKYSQITSGERYTLSALHKQGISQAQIARQMGRHPSTISRELRRNRSAFDGAYRPDKAVEKTNGRRSRSRRNGQFAASDYQLIEQLIREDYSPEQAAGHLRKHGLLQISHETIYVHLLRDKKNGGALWKHLRCAKKRKRKRYGAYDSRGRLAGKKHISERPAAVEARKEFGHWEMDTIMGNHASQHCALSLVERVSGYTLLGKLADRRAETATARAIALIRDSGLPFKTITADNGTEFHDYKSIERATGVPIFFATPYHSWERGTNENTNGLIRQYLPKGKSMSDVSQHHCNAISIKLNHRPRKRHAYRSPAQTLLRF